MPWQYGSLLGCYWSNPQGEAVLASVGLYTFTACILSLSRLITSDLCVTNYPQVHQLYLPTSETSILRQIQLSQTLAAMGRAAGIQMMNRYDIDFAGPSSSPAQNGIIHSEASGPVNPLIKAVPHARWTAWPQVLAAGSSLNRSCQKGGTAEIMSCR